MRLVFEAFDGRKRTSRTILDKDTGHPVGCIRTNGNGSGGIDISLFGGKYRGSFKSNAEVCAFIKGIEVVLNHMTYMPNLDAASEAA